MENKPKAKKYQFITKDESDRLRKIMMGIGGYDHFKQKWIDFGNSKPIPSMNVYYNVLNGRSAKLEVMSVIKEIVDGVNMEIKEFKQSLK